MKVWILVIEHERGVSVWPCEDEELCWERLQAWVDEWWQQEMKSAYKPTKGRKAIEKYFENVDEYYSIHETELMRRPKVTPGS